MRDGHSSWINRIYRLLDRATCPSWRLAVPILLALFAIMEIVPLVSMAATFDETAHLYAGVSYLERRDFRLNPEHPPLAKLWAALPLWMSGDASMKSDAPAWQQGDEWILGFEYLNGPANDEHRRNPAARLIPARCFMVLLGAALGWLVFTWSNELWGEAAGVVALMLHCLCTAMLAHSCLVTMDAPAALGFVLSLWTFWRCVRRPTLRSVGIAGLSLGVALCLKFSMLVLPPLLLGLLIVWRVDRRREPGAPAVRLRTDLGLVVAVGLVAWLCIWGAYGFQYRFTNDSLTFNDWERVAPPSGLVGTVLSLARKLKTLPEAYLYGIGYTIAGGRRSSFLNGEILSQGSWLYMPEAFLLKTSPALLILVGWSIWHGVRRSAEPGSRAYLWVPIGVYALLSVAFGLSIGHRHLLPIYPLLYIQAAGVVTPAVRTHFSKAVLVCLLAVHAGSAAFTYPHFLSYFNIAAGGAGGGRHFLVDSNLDWGQDLPKVKRWMDENRVEEIHLAYFGTADPRAYGIRYRKMYQFLDFRPEEGASFPKPGEYLAVSVTLLQGLYVTEPTTEAVLRKLRESAKPVGTAGPSIFIFRIEG
jgi:hypothetical protein